MGLTVTLGKPPPRFLVLRHLHQDPGFFDEFLRWVLRYYPDRAPLFLLNDLPNPIRDYPNYVLHLPWLQDPVQNWSEETYALACELAGHCEARGIPIVNRVDRLLNTTKCRGSEIMRQAGFRTPLMRLLNSKEDLIDALKDFPFPALVREDWGHGGPMLPITTPAEAEEVVLSEFKRPLLVEVVDVRSTSDGCFRKYRYIAAGDVGVSHHLVVSLDWVTHGTGRILNDSTRAEELAYIGDEDAHHGRFQVARRALGLDFLAFDYGITADGEVVVWEANPYPKIALGRKETAFRNHAIHRTYAAMLYLYLSSAGLPAPSSLQERLAYPVSPEDVKRLGIPPDWPA